MRGNSPGEGCYAILASWGRKRKESRAGNTVHGLYHPSFQIEEWRDLVMGIKLSTQMVGAEDFLWPEKNYYEIIAIAQHFGLPTRFLDFTYDPLIAIYFAARDSLSKGLLNNMAIYWFSLETQDCIQPEANI